MAALERGKKRALAGLKLPDTEQGGCACGCSRGRARVKLKSAAGGSGATKAKQTSPTSPTTPAAATAATVRVAPDSSATRGRKIITSLLLGRRERIIIALFLFIIGLIFHILKNKYLDLAFFIPAYLLVGLDVLREAWADFRQGELFNEQFLMTVATLAAWGLGEYPEAVAIMLFYELGEYIQALAIARSQNAVAALSQLVAETALVQRNDTFVALAPQELELGETIMLRAGMRVPVDAVVLQGCGSVDEAALTGESRPRVVEVGSSILAGTINLDGVLLAEVKASYANSTLQKIIELTAEASLHKTKTELLIRRFAKIYTPLVLLLALAIFILPPLSFSSLPALLWFKRALNLLIISCPCAFVLAVPLSYYSGLNLAARQGVLVKGSAVFERLARLNTLFFDKTGTLTKGEFSLERIELLAAGSEAELLLAAATLESASSHPLAKALVKANSELFGGSSSVYAGATRRECAGRGLVAELGSSTYYLGNAKHLEENGFALPPAWREDSAGTSQLYFAQSEAPQLGAALTKTLLGRFSFKDELKPEAAASLQQLRSLGLRKLQLLSGDNEASVAAVAQELPLDAAVGALLPHDKLAHLEEAIAQRALGEWVGFVGDGLNDAPVLSLADVGFAMGELGSDAAIEAADVVLLRDDLRSLPQAIKIARQTQNIARQNIALALGIKFLVICLSFLGIGGLWAAIFADVGVTILAVLNALRLNLLGK